MTATESRIEREDRLLVVDGNRVRIIFPYEPVIVAAVKMVKGAKYDGGSGRKCWYVPARMECLRSLAEFANAHQFSRDQRLRELWVELREGARENLAASRAGDADYEVPGLGGTLDPFQRAGVAYLVRNRRCLLADDMGLGKSIQTLAVLQALTAFPAVIVCPAFLCLNWQREAGIWLPEKTARIIGEDVPYPTTSAHINILSYDRMVTHLEGLRALEMEAVVFDEAHYLKDPKTARSKAAVKLALGVATILELTGTPLVNGPRDLIHLLKILGRIDDLGGEQTFKERYCDGKLVETWVRGCRAIGGKPCEPVTFEQLRARDEALHRAGDEILFTSEARGGVTTAIAKVCPGVRYLVTEKTKESVALARGNMTISVHRDLFTLGCWRVIKRMDYSGSGDLTRLGAELRKTCMVRRRKADVLTELPPKRRSWVPVALTGTHATEYRKAEADVLRWIGEKAAANPDFRAAMRVLSPEAQIRAMCERAQEAASRAEKCEELVRMGVLLRIAAEGKLAAMEAWVKTFLESRESLVLFGRSVEVLKMVSAKFGHAPLIIGETPTAKRQAIVDGFQAGKIPLLCLSYGAGGVGLTLTRASNVASIELPWTAKDLDQGEDRTHRRGQRGAVNCWHMIATGTVDYVVRDLLLKKAAMSAEVMA